MGDAHAALRKRLLFTSRRRGMRESDFLLGGFAMQQIDRLDGTQLGRFEALLEQSDPDLMAWITGVRPVPPEWDNDVMRLLQDYRDTLSVR